MILQRTTMVYILAAVLLAACGQTNEGNQIKLKGSGTMVETTYELADFDGVDASQTFEVTITPGDTFSVVVRVDDNVQPYLDVRVRNNTLLLGLDDKNNYSLDGSVTLEAAITMPELVSIRASGSSTATANGFTSERAFAADASGASELTFDATGADVTISASGSSTITGTFEAAGDVSLNASGNSRLNVTGSGEALRAEASGSSQIEGALDLSEDVTLTESGASTISLTGSGRTLTLDLSGSSKALLADFAVTDASVKASGGSEAVLNLNGTLNANVSGSSRIRYAGEVTLGEIVQANDSSVMAAE